MSRSAQDILALLAQRKTTRNPMLAAMEQVRSLYNAEVAVPLPEMDKNEQAAVANLLKSGIDGTAQRVNSTLPDVYFPPGKPGQKRSEADAETARRAVLGWWYRNNMQVVMSRRVRHFLGYGASPVILRPDRDMRHARWEVRDPLSAYPAPGVLDDITPSDVIFTYNRPVTWLKQNHPDIAARLRLNPNNPIVQLVEYQAMDETVLLVCGHQNDPYSSPDPYLSAEIELSRVPNPTGMCLAVMPGRVTLDRGAGQFDGLIPMFYRQAKLDALEYIAIEQGVFPRMWLVANPGETPQIITMADGRKGEVGIVKGGRIQEENLNPGYKTSQAIDRLASEQRLEGNVPAEMQGVSGTNIRTGRRGDEVLANGIDYGIQEAQRVLEISLREENRRAVALTKHYFGAEKHSFYVAWRGATGPVEYTPDSVFTSDTNIVKYALAGSDLNGQVVRTGQKLGAGLISKQTARRQDPEIADPDFEDHQIVAEQAETAFLQGLSQQMASGQFPPADAAEFVRLVKTEKLQPIEAFQKVQELAQQRQATSGEPGTPEGPVAPQAPEAQPGVSPGSEAGVPIGPPPTATANLMDILRNAGRERSAMRAG